MQYADPETRIAAWLHDQLGCKMWADPEPPDNWPFTAPLGWIQRGDGDGDTALTLDSGIYDLSFIGNDAATLRGLAEQARYAIRFLLPGYTWGDGVTVNGTRTISAPAWRPDPAFKRGATYGVILHGLI